MRKSIPVATGTTANEEVGADRVDDGAVPPTSDEAWHFLWDKVLSELDPDLDPAEVDHELQADLSELRQSRDPAHVSAAALAALLRSTAVSRELFETLLPHLSRCAFCRDTLRQTLRLVGADAAQGGYALLRRAEEWASRREAGRTAAVAAQAALRAQGVGVVYQQRDGGIVKESPDGTIRPYVAEDGCSTEPKEKE